MYSIYFTEQPTISCISAKNHLQKINAQYADELKQAAADVIDSGWFLMGNQLSSFENNNNFKK